MVRSGNPWPQIQENRRFRKAQRRPHSPLCGSPPSITKWSAQSPVRFPAWHYKVVRTVPCAVPRLALQSGPHRPLCGSSLTIRPHSFHIRVPKKASSFHPFVTLHSTFAFQKKHPPLTVSKSPHLKVPARKASPSDAGGSTSPSPQVSSAPAQPPPSLTAHHCQESTPDPFLLEMHHESRLSHPPASQTRRETARGSPHSSFHIRISSFSRPSLPPDPLTPRPRATPIANSTRPPQKQFPSSHTRSPFVPLSGGVRGPPNPTGQGDSSFSLTSTPQFPKNAPMIASLSTPKPPLAATMRKAISYP